MGHTVTKEVTWPHIMQVITRAERGIPELIEMETTAQHMVANRDHPKISVDMLKGFNGTLIDWEDWYIGTGAML